MQVLDYYVEQPRTHLGHGEAEFFLQQTAPGVIATGAHLHDAVELLYIRQGSYTAYLDGVEYSLFPGDLILFRANTIHYVLAGGEPENSYYVMKLRPAVLLELSPNGADYAMGFTLKKPEQQCLWTREALEENHKILSVLQTLTEEYHSRNYAADAAIRLKLTELLLLLLRADPATHPDRPADPAAGQIYRSTVYVREHYGEDFSEKELSAQLGMSYSYFSRSFRRVTGMSFRQYLNAVRVGQAEQLLLTTDKSVTEVASLCGYNQVSYFISVFRKLRGRTPRRR